MTKQYCVKLEKESLIFSAAHFITFAGNICERLHGHNYRVFAEVYGPLDENEYVIDFIALRDALQAITQELDHRMLLPESHPTIKVQADAKEVLVTFEDRRWIFPLDDCAILPMNNTTAERLAEYISERLLSALKVQGITNIQKLVLGVDENEGQWAIATTVAQ
ncbi:MAG: 6-pyruvoyl tetrahydropterin synthase family protein [Planctomycetaceae bacterium]|jgi:6-pyruvoyltetrahydropterin/6-carboxytetrahydropterin synthase|nr:6-pyruvoyl tetrahydropterin synthase family protein [Planctomycetaceae bacterium]MBT4723785.1 6-pyruvoyl tetrahydropterin synthase family protein [Planctomycetaceae bacterium]MBT4846619.1 6-pyruvoyl tetrahydropterin synthase family protein [Planctomycetaceae bacterium]MBT5126347.1 6-pyruvoyl tetrahydropterin synthase family protein [Planctomycetaceae bacterium]MBT5597351.1 6-pyruvoyl tetrahydropterin synthase family protein [Planctomycetaceae bacterium]